ncbi:Mast/stem cell growth factor receptor Kit like [Heracleum sosnowskyi]|uniref:Mast/stem cell growth factor receptor Kit like n=1 Tax=Heracleum sosnowskyi TaxID=360622 RepID=A0AAD8MY53_9APIA|nr:Mast/stem cell growth factor receptor Kit like [Heracleum sosnowskyi]
MALVQQRSSCRSGVITVTLGFLALCLAGYIVGPPLYWHFMEGVAAITRSSPSSYSYSCPPCHCDDCSSQPLVSIPQGLSNSTFADCAKHDPSVSEDTEKNFAELLSEELKLREAESTESQQRADMALLEAKKLTSQYQKEADKCNSGMETCEEARAKSEASLLEQKKLTSMWESRARQKGWKEGVAKSSTQAQ